MAAWTAGILLALGLALLLLFSSRPRSFLEDESAIVIVRPAPYANGGIRERQLSPAETTQLLALMRKGKRYPKDLWDSASGDTCGMVYLTFISGGKKHEVHVWEDQYCIVGPGVSCSLARNRMICPGIFRTLLSMQQSHPDGGDPKGGEPRRDGLKNNASPEGLDDALRDIVIFKASLRKKSPEELILAFTPDQSPKKFGGYDYYYKYMANRAVCDELKSRGDAARVALRAHVGDKVRLYEAINGPGNTVGYVCQSLLEGKEPVP
jgi:hypothetical protein